MIYSDDGSTVTLSAAEYAVLRGAEAKAMRIADDLVRAAQEREKKAVDLLDAAMNKEANMRYQLDLKNSLNRYEDNQAQAVRSAEHFMREIYHTLGSVSRTARTELENKMKELRGY